MRRGLQTLRRFVWFLALLGQYATAEPADAAGWLIDLRKFHVSAHGQTACTDCHGDIAGKDLHPDPADVNRPLRDFFEPDKCLACHDHVMDDLKSGLHGVRPVEEIERYGNCLRCHDPHRQPRLGENRMGRFDPTIPKHLRCGSCHDERSTLPRPAAEDEVCLSCHRLVDPADPPGQAHIREFCFFCHAGSGEPAQKIAGGRVALIDPASYRGVPHAALACTDCHPRAARFRHGSQEPGDCLGCHVRHNESVAHDSHLSVRCGTCHLADVRPRRDPRSGMVGWEIERVLDQPLGIHAMQRSGDQAECRRCHISGNRVGAAAMLLPPKSVLCMPCHPATFSAGDTVTVLSLIVFLAGALGAVGLWLGGSSGAAETAAPSGATSVPRRAVRFLFSRRPLILLGTLFWDVLLQRRLYRRSRLRWTFHGLIFFPLLLRFGWGLAALLGSRWTPAASLPWSMLDKNHPITAFLFDVTGFMLMLGIGLAFLRGASRHVYQPPGLPRQDRVALGLLAGVAVLGFVLEAVRLSMTGRPPGAGYAFAGYALSRLLGDSAHWNDVYGYLWYGHALLTGAFAAYLPFSRMLHIILAPVVLAVGRASDHEHRQPLLKE